MDNERKFVYILTDLDENKEKSACIRVEDGFRLIFTVKINNQKVIPQQLVQDMIKMIDIFDENVELDGEGYIRGPSFITLDWSEDIVERYKRYIIGK